MHNSSSDDVVGGFRPTTNVDRKRLLIIADQLGENGGLDFAAKAEVGRQLLALCGCRQIAAGEIALLTSRYLRVLEVVFASAQRHSALQQQLTVSPYAPSVIPVLMQNPCCEEVFSFLGQVVMDLQAGVISKC